MMAGDEGGTKEEEEEEQERGERIGEAIAPATSGDGGHDNTASCCFF